MQYHTEQYPITVSVKTEAYVMDPKSFLQSLCGPNGGSSEMRPHKVVEWARRLGDGEGLAFWEVVIGSWSGFDLIPH